jgi:hypothetical protein
VLAFVHHIDTPSSKAAYIRYLSSSYSFDGSSAVPSLLPASFHASYYAAYCSCFSTEIALGFAWLATSLPQIDTCDSPEAISLFHHMSIFQAPHNVLPLALVHTTGNPHILSEQILLLCHIPGSHELSTTK